MTAPVVALAAVTVPNPDRNTAKNGAATSTENTTGQTQ